MLRLGSLVVAGALVSAAGGCEDGDGRGDHTGTAAGTTSRGSDSTTVSTMDGDAYCAQFESADTCAAASGVDVSCGWKAITTFSLIVGKNVHTSKSGLFDTGFN